MLRLRDLGEFSLIARILRAAGHLPSPASVVVGPGDDAAVLRPAPGEDVVVTTDAIVEGVHFRWHSDAPHAVGRRALVANLSDLAAMGARPLGFVLALAAPPALPVRRVDGLVAGLLREAAAHGCPLVGGNLSAARETSLTITAVGAVPRGRALSRGGARAGDRICVTGTLGGAALDRARAERGRGRTRHLPQPRLRAGRALARLRGVGGVIDVSDGLDADLAHLLEGRALSAEIDPARLPVPRGFAAACARLRLDPERVARTGGEDYELLFTLRPGAPGGARLSRRLGVRVTEIGRVRPAARDRHQRVSPGGWRHF
jgi:thiamine-monophosphate kinase